MASRMVGCSMTSHVPVSLFGLITYWDGTSRNDKIARK